MKIVYKIYKMEKKMDNNRIISNQMRKTISIAFVLLCVTVLFFISKRYLPFLYDVAALKNKILHMGKFGIIYFILFQILQVILFFIPGEVVQIAGGYMYGTIFGTALSIIGILLGSIITFYIARSYGDKFLKRILPIVQYEKVKNLIDKKRNKKIVFILFLIPGFPKDIVGYVCGITKLNLKNFMLLVVVGRIPGILMSVYFGSNLYHGKIIPIMLMMAILIPAILLAIFKGDELIQYLEK